MAKIKYAEGATPLLNEHDGYTFQPSHAGQSMFPASRSARKRYKHQFEKMQANQRAVTRWREMSAETKTAWNDFAATFPQPSKRDPNTFLTGFQCFIRRNSFCFYNHGILTDFILEPELEISDEDEITFEIKASNTVIECADNYIKNFGLLPQVGDKLLCYAAVYSEFSGHFYESVRTSLIVEEIYIDSFQVSVIVPDSFKSVSVSLYLSKPVSPGQEYTGTKCRYMGCFTTKTFLQLQDTPRSYAGKGNQIVRVKITEDGLEFAEMDAGGNAFNPITVDGQDNVTADSVAEALELVAGEGITIETDNTNKQIIISAASGGGFDCDDLLDCDIITDIIETITDDGTSSIPAIHFGLLYNAHAVNSPKGMTAAGWHIPTVTEFNTIYDSLGGINVACVPMRLPPGTYWRSTDVYPGTNAAKTNVKAGGDRAYANGDFSRIRDYGYLWTSTIPFAGYNRCYRFIYDQIAVQYRYDRQQDGFSVIAIKDSNPVSDGQNGHYYGNDGKIYRTIGIGGHEITVDPLAETKFRDGSLIPEIVDNTEWGYASTPGLCAYDNDWSNV